MADLTESLNSSGAGGGKGGRSVKLFVGQVPKHMTEAELFSMFMEVALVDEVNIIKDKTTRTSRGCCFLICPSRQEADKVVTACHNKRKLPGASSPLLVKYADGELERLEHKLYVDMLPNNVSDAEVSTLFSQYGNIKDLQILRGSQQTSKGCAFLKYEAKEQALAALEAINGKYKMEGSSVPLVVKWADTQKERQLRGAQKAQSKDCGLSTADLTLQPLLFGDVPVGLFPNKYQNSLPPIFSELWVGPGRLVGSAGESLPEVNPSGDAKPQGVLLEAHGKDCREIDLELEHSCLDRSMADDSNNDAGQHDGEGHHASIKLRDANYLVDSFKVKLESAFQSERKKICGASTSFFGKECCIYRVEEKFHELNRRAYIPDLVSFGPFHHGKGNLPAMEQYKLLYLRNLLARATTTTEWSSILKECVESMKSIEEEARKCYSESINLSSNEFVEMMLVDGLFIIELFRKSTGEVSIDRDDPFFNNTFNLSTLIHDLVLLENQLPMLVLNRLLNIPKLRMEIHFSSITMLALNFFNPLMPRDKEVLEKYSDYEGKHLLDLLGKTIFPLPSRCQTTNNSWKSIPAATELKTAGVKFKKSSTKGSFLDIKFSNDGVLEIPPVIIEDQNATLLRNLLAFEQCSGGSDTYMTSYVILMKSFINSTSDAGFLRKQGIVTGDLCVDEDFSNIFNELSCGLNTLGNFYYSEFCDQVNTHYKNKSLWDIKSFWDILNATLNHDYSGNLFTYLAVPAVLVLALPETFILYIITGGVPIEDYYFRRVDVLYLIIRVLFCGIASFIISKTTSKVVMLISSLLGLLYKV